MLPCAQDLTSSTLSEWLEQTIYLAKLESQQYKVSTQSTTVLHSMVQHSWYSTVQYSIVWYNTVQYSIVQYSTVQYGTVGIVHYSTGVYCCKLNYILMHDVRCCSVIFCTILYVLYYSTLYNTVLYYFVFILSYTILYYTILSYIILYYTVL